MDVKQGMNSEEQVKLLEFVKENNNDIMDIPTIVVCNKVEDMTNTEIMGLVGEGRHAGNAPLEWETGSKPWKTFTLLRQAPSF